MKPVRRLWVHAALLAVASLGALYVWTRDTETTNTAGDVRVWGGKPADVQKIAVETKTRQATIESRTDGAGRWFEGTATSIGRPGPGELDEHGHPPHDHDHHDHDHHGHEGPGGDDAANDTPRTFQVVSVKPAERIAEALAPLFAVREVGAIEGDPAEDFGLGAPLGTLTFTIGGVERKLAIGGEAPGGSDRYVRNLETSIIYAVRGDFVRDLLAGEAALNERDLHGFDEEDVQHVVITAGEKSRQVHRKGGAGGQATWSDPTTPDQPDEIATAWIGKLDRLRPTEYLAEEPTNAVLVVRIEYFGRKGSVGFLELQRIPDQEAGFLVRTEYTRRFARTAPSAAEQVEQELKTLL